ncbi:MAG: hypothetical protein WAL99_01400 [Pseudonocardiaceae bacterium]
MSLVTLRLLLSVMVRLFSVTSYLRSGVEGDVTGKYFLVEVWCVAFHGFGLLHTTPGPTSNLRGLLPGIPARRFSCSFSSASAAR